MRSPTTPDTAPCTRHRSTAMSTATWLPEPSAGTPTCAQWARSSSTITGIVLTFPGRSSGGGNSPRPRAAATTPSRASVSEGSTASSA